MVLQGTLELRRFSSLGPDGWDAIRASRTTARAAAANAAILGANVEIPPAAPSSSHATLASAAGASGEAPAGSPPSQPAWQAGQPSQPTGQA